MVHRRSAAALLRRLQRQVWWLELPYVVPQDGSQQDSDYQKYTCQYDCDPQKYACGVEQGGNQQGSDYQQYMNQLAGAYQQYMSLHELEGAEVVVDPPAGSARASEDEEEPLARPLPSLPTPQQQGQRQRGQQQAARIAGAAGERRSRNDTSVALPPLPSPPVAPEEAPVEKTVDDEPVAAMLPPANTAEAPEEAKEDLDAAIKTAKHGEDNYRFTAVDALLEEKIKKQFEEAFNNQRGKHAKMDIIVSMLTDSLSNLANETEALASLAVHVKTLTDQLGKVADNVNSLVAQHHELRHLVMPLGERIEMLEDALVEVL